MIVHRTPQFRMDGYEVQWSSEADMLTVNGEVFDFSAIPEGGELPAGICPCDQIVGPVRRMDGEIVLTLVEPYGPEGDADVDA